MALDPHPERRPRTTFWQAARVGDYRERYEPKWVWMLCPNCRHRKPVPWAPLAILLGMDATTDEAAKLMKCAICAHRGAIMQKPNLQGVAGGLEMESFPLEVIQFYDHRRVPTRLPAPMRAP